MEGAAAQVEEGKVDVGAVVIPARGGLAARVPEPARTFAMARGGVAETIERFEFQDFVCFRIGGDDFFDGENFHGAAAAYIGRDQILSVRLIEANGFGGVRE